MSSMKIEYEQQGVFFECKKCPDCYLHTGKENEFRCHYYVNDWQKIDCDPFSDVPEWCPRFPL